MIYPDHDGGYVTQQEATEAVLRRLRSAMRARGTANEIDLCRETGCDPLHPWHRRSVRMQMAKLERTGFVAGRQVAMCIREWRVL